MKSFENTDVPYAAQLKEVEDTLLPVIGNLQTGVAGDLRVPNELRVGLAHLLVLVNRLAQSAALVEGQDWPDADEVVLSPELVP